MRAVGDELGRGEIAVGPEAAGVDAGGVFGSAHFHPEDQRGLVGEHHGFETAHGAAEIDDERSGEGARGIRGVAGLDARSAVGGGEPGDGEGGAAGVGGGAVDGAGGDFPAVVAERGGGGPRAGGEVEGGEFIVANFVGGVAAVGGEDAIAGEDGDGVLAAGADVGVDGPLLQRRAVGCEETREEFHRRRGRRRRVWGLGFGVRGRMRIGDFRFERGSRRGALFAWGVGVADAGALEPDGEGAALAERREGNEFVAEAGGGAPRAAGVIGT